MEFLFYTRGNGCVSSCPFYPHLNTIAKRREFVGDSKATKFKVFKENPPTSPHWNGTTYVTGYDISEQETKLYSSCIKYQQKQMDINLTNELTKAETLIESGNATNDDLPKATNVSNWLQGLWAEYYNRKSAIVLTSHCDLSFALLGKCPHTFTELREERKTFLTA
jgi:hypothetical protein